MSVAADSRQAVELEVDGRIVRVSSPDRVYFSARGETKLDLARERERRLPYLAELPPRFDPHVDVQPVPARGLRPAHRPDLVEHLASDARHAAHGVKARFGHRVEVDPPLVGLFDVPAPGVPGVKLHRRHLHGPDHAAQLGHA